MDELMDKNLPFFVGGNLATLTTTDAQRRSPHVLSLFCTASRSIQILYSLRGTVE